MKKRNNGHNSRDELRREYDLSKLKGRVRGKYATKYRAGTNAVLLAPDVAKYFPDQESVHAALRALIRVAKQPVRRTKQAARPRGTSVR